MGYLEAQPAPDHRSGPEVILKNYKLFLIRPLRPCDVSLEVNLNKGEAGSRPMVGTSIYIYLLKVFPIINTIDRLVCIFNDIRYSLWLSVFALEDSIFGIYIENELLIFFL